jgi:hypothetical protein
MLPAGVQADFPLAENDQTTARGLRLYDRFIMGEEKASA